MEQSTRVRPQLAPAVRPAGWWVDALLLAGFAALTAALAAGWLLGIDVAVLGWVDRHRPPELDRAALVLNFLGQGGWVLLPLAGGLAVAVGWRTRSLRPLLVVAAALLLTSLTIGPVKLLVHRGFPHRDRRIVAHPERLFSDSAEGLAYPSGHVANAIVWYGIIALLAGALLASLGRPDLPPAVRRAVRVVPPAIVFCTTTYLGHHWLTDSVAGLLLGLLLDRLLRRVPWSDLLVPGSADRRIVSPDTAGP